MCAGQLPGETIHDSAQVLPSYLYFSFGAALFKDALENSNNSTVIRRHSACFMNIHLLDLAAPLGRVLRALRLSEIK